MSVRGKVSLTGGGLCDCWVELDMLQSRRYICDTGISVMTEKRDRMTELIIQRCCGSVLQQRSAAKCNRVRLNLQLDGNATVITERCLTGSVSVSLGDAADPGCYYR